MGSDVGQIFSTARLHRDLSILYALVFEKTRTIIFAHDCILLKMKVELLKVRKKINVEFQRLKSASNVVYGKTAQFCFKHLFNALNMLSAMGVGVLGSE